MLSKDCGLGHARAGSQAFRLPDFYTTIIYHIPEGIVEQRLDCTVLASVPERNIDFWLKTQWTCLVPMSLLATRCLHIPASSYYYHIFISFPDFELIPMREFSSRE